MATSPRYGIFSLALIVPFVLALTAARPATADVQEPSSGQSFAEARGSQALLGVGIRKKWGFKVYAMGLYADKDAASKLAPGSYGAVVRGGFAKTVELRMLRTVAGEKIQGAFEDALAEPTGKSPEYQQFLSFFGGELAKGTVILLKTSGPTLNVVVGGSAKPAINNAVLTGALLNVWLGPKPIDGGLKKNLISRLGSL
jgi:hypothetical protein